MKKNIKSNDDIINEAIKQLQKQYVDDEFYELSQEEINDFLEDGDEYTKPVISLSLKYFSDSEINETSVTERSIFKENIWTLEGLHRPKSIHFSYKLNEHDSSDNYPHIVWFIKLLLLFYLPNHADKVTSVESVITIASKLRLLVNYLFIENHLLNPKKDVALLTLKQVNDAINKSKKHGKTSHFESLTTTLQYWIKLSESNILPEEYEFPFSYGEIFTVDLLKEIFSDKLNRGAYTPLSEDEIELISTTSYDLIENKSDDLIFLSKKLTNNVVVVKNDIRRRKIQRDSRDAKLIENYPYVKNNNGNSWIKIKYNAHNEIKTSELRPLFKELKGACICMILLLTGMRIRELQNLKIDCAKQTSKNTYTLKYQIFKTTYDAEEGETQNIPIPEIIFKAINALAEIDSYYRKESRSSYLLVSSSVRKQIRYTLSRNVIRYIIDSFVRKHGMSGITPHRFRKTIAWLLISRSEKNIDIIRHIFGHHSYKMTLQYILRNYELVTEVVKQLSIHYTEEFTDLTKSIISGHYTGPAAERLANSIKGNPKQFNAQTLRTTLHQYVYALLESGEPLFIHRIPVGAWCLSVPVVASKRTPCTAELSSTDRVVPDVSLCKYEDCDKFAGTQDAITGIERNIKFCSDMLKIEGLDKNLRIRYEHKIKKNKVHLNNINKSRPLIINDIEVI